MGHLSENRLWRAARQRSSRVPASSRAEILLGGLALLAVLGSLLLCCGAGLWRLPASMRQNAARKAAHKIAREATHAPEPRPAPQDATDAPNHPTETPAHP